MKGKEEERKTRRKRGRRRILGANYKLSFEKVKHQGDNTVTKIFFQTFIATYLPSLRTVRNR